MADYYSILGIAKTANDVEIKAAFRRLAKIYHPDKNPNNPEAKHVFQNVLKAYNTLIHPSLRRRYDQRGSELYAQPLKTQHAKRKNQKEWTFTEEELQRRQYYEKHYKAKQQERARQPAPVQKAHSDYKYILFATPIAVALLMLILYMFTETPKTVPLPPKKTVIESVKPLETRNSLTLQLPNGEKPYTGYFKGIKTFNTPNSFTINNASNYDAVIVVLDKKTNAYLQHAYLQSSYSIEFYKLPDAGVYWKCMLGKNWDENKFVLHKEVIGAFDSIVQYQNRQKTPILFAGNKRSDVEVLEVIKPHSKTKRYISNETDFFAK